jgi:hypothetical protein
MSATAMMNLRGANATDAKPVPGRITGARSSASPPVPRGDRNLVISGPQISRGLGGAAPPCSQPDRGGQSG